MSGFCSTLLRLCLCLWGGMSLFFVVSVLPVLAALVTDRPPLSRFSHPTFFLPSYFAFGIGLLGLALICACGNLWNTRIGALRKWMIVALVAVTVCILTIDYALVYPALVNMFSPQATAVNAASVVSLYQLTTFLKKVPHRNSWVNFAKLSAWQC
jgi:hypothetical protein